MVSETEAERRYKMDQAKADMALEGCITEPTMDAITERYIAGEITQDEMGRLLGEEADRLNAITLASSGH